MKYSNILSLLLFSLAAVYAGVDQNPVNAGTTQTRNTLGRGHEAAWHNPALLGVDRAPGASISPGTTIGVGSWSNKLRISPFTNYWAEDKKGVSSLVSGLLRNSFDLDGLTPPEVSDKLTKELKGGLDAYYGLRYSLFSLGWQRIAFDVTTHVDEQIHIPEGSLYALFSNTKGLLPGNTLDFSKLKQDAIWATDFSMHLGLPVTIPALHKLFGLRYGAGGIGIKYVMGHSILRASAEDAKLTYNNNSYDVSGKVNIQTAGAGFSGAWNAKNPFENGLPVSGHGIGVDIGGILYDKNGSLSINFNNLGVLFWMNGVREVTYRIDKKNFDAYDIVDGIELADKQDRNARLVIFNRDEGEYLSMEDDTLKESNGFTTVLPMALNIGYSYSWDFSKTANQTKRWIADYANVGANYQQQLTKNPGQSFIPRLSVGGEAGMVHGFLPLRVGLILGGPEKAGSTLGAGLNFKYVALNASYKAVGTPIFIPKRGLELAAGLQINWRLTIDTDRDGIIDRDDKCPDVAEDHDGFEDADGCPDYDNDNDGIPDSLDKCFNLPEDKDGFQDADGCPDYDNDNDGIPDSLDKCPMEPEDKDNYNDNDGCPDLDNDGDGIPDSLDKCPILAEDIDMFEDSDGCPEYDNDKDGIPDSVDNCMNEPETFNGYKDEDGCPDTLIRPSEKETKVLNTKLRSINFESGSAKLLSSSYAALDFVVEFLKQYPSLRYEIQGHTDSIGSDDFNLVLSAARAGTVRQYLLSKGIPEDNLIAIGYGETMPVDDNSKSSGRALNRRVAFKIIETSDEYKILKTNEELFQERIRAAKIKGYK